jgi:AcrR family transcriptional regulator
MNVTVLKTSRDRRRDAIVEVARQVFFEEGYAAASMSTIAARLGGSKGTLYNYFRSKEELFEAQVREGCERIAEDAFDLSSSGDLPIGEVLAQLGERYLKHLYSEWAVRTYRVVVAEAVRSPQLARIFYEVGPAVGLKRLEDYLKDARARGVVKIEDCTLAAGEFLTLCRGHQHFVYVLNLEAGPSPERIKTQAAHAVTLFLNSYGV